MNPIYGKLTLDAFPHQWFTIGASVSILGGGLIAVILLTYFKKWKWLWKEWLTTCDPKKIGIMYIIVAALMLFRGALDAGMIWLQQILSVGSSHGYLDAGHFQQIFTAHGDIMVFFVAMGFMAGLLNLIVPLQIGTRDLAFPFMNSLGFWLYVAGAVFINLFFVIGGDFAPTGWLSLPPLSELAFNPGVGVDYWIWSLQISGLGSLIAGINFIVTILKMRAPGMSLMKMPMFTWTALVSMVLVVCVFPILAITIGMLWLDRFFGMHFFTSTMGGNPMMYINLIWMWGHPEVYILVIPFFGVYSEIVSTFSQKKLFGYAVMVGDAIAIMLLAMLVWLHHFFTMGAGGDVNAFFGIMTGVIAIPTGMQIFNWLTTMYKGKIIMKTPMYWFLGFVFTFTLGGMAGLLLSSPATDFQFHNSLFLVAHFHTMVFGGALFGIFAALVYWFPKIAGYKLDEKWGLRAFWAWLIGFFFSFTPLYILGFMGATRRLDHYTDPSWRPLFITSGIGICIIALGALFQLIQLYVSYRDREKNRDLTGDPWNGRTLEWSVPSPAPFYAFRKIPQVTDRDAWWAAKQATNGKQIVNSYENIELPKNTAMAIYLSGFVFIMAFGLVWHIIWLAILGIIGAIACIIIRSLDEDTEYVIPAEEIERLDKLKAN